MANTDITTRPVERPCPHCDGKLVSLNNVIIECTNCEYILASG